MENVGDWVRNRPAHMVFVLRAFLVEKSRTCGTWCFLALVDIGLGSRVPLDDLSSVGETEAV